MHTPSKGEVLTPFTPSFSVSQEGGTRSRFISVADLTRPDWSLAVGMNRSVQRLGHQAIDACTEAVGSVAIRVGR